MNQQDLYVIVLGMAIVFIGLISIILLCKVMSAVCNMKIRSADAVPVPAQAPVSASPSADIPNRAEFIAAVSAAIAEEIGEDASSIRILSVKKI